MESDVTRAIDLLGLAIAASEQDGRDVGIIRVYFNALRERMREEQVARDEAWTLVSHQVTRLLHPALDRQTMNEIGAIVSKIADAMLADEPLPEDVAALLPSDEMHRDGTPKAPLEPTPLDGLDVDEEENRNWQPEWPLSEIPLPRKGDVGPPVHHIATPRVCQTRWARHGAQHIHACVLVLNHLGEHRCQCGGAWTQSL